MNPKVSVIIPVFNTERYLAECLVSVRDQVYRDFECIVVDDGSTDNSYEIARSSAANDPRFVFVRQDNAGHSAARNHGISIARGDYIIFLDSDDILPSSALQVLVGEAIGANADIVTGLAESFSETKRWKNAQMTELAGVAGHYESILDAVELARDASPCNKLIRASLIHDNGLLFPLGVPVREDLHLVLRAYCLSKSIVVIDEVVYFYRLRDKDDDPSHTQVVGDNVFLGLVRVHRDLTAFLTDHQLHALCSPMSVGILGNVAYRLGPYVTGDCRDSVLEAVADMLESIPTEQFDLLPGAEDRVLMSLMATRRFDLVHEFASEGLTSGLVSRILMDDTGVRERLANHIILYQQRWIERLRRTTRQVNVRSEVRRLAKNKAKQVVGPLPSTKSIGRELKLTLARAKVSTLASPAKPVWVIGERRGTSAEDTGYHLFRYLREKRPEIDCYFVCKDDAKFAAEARSHGNVVRFGSVESFELIMKAEAICYSDSCADVAHKWTRIRPHVPSTTVGCFLQHGVIGLHGMRGFYHRDRMIDREELVDLFVVSSAREAEMVHEHLGHPMSNIISTGLSRHDALSPEPASSRQILFMPTWRPWLKGVSGAAFFESEYYRTIQEFIGSPELAQSLQQHDLEMVVCQHFAMSAGSGSSLRSSSDRIRVVNTPDVRVQDFIRESAMMVTDYSSVAHDFSYQGRPVVYWMFDRKQFYRTSKPMLNPEQDLPGPVVSSRFEVLREIEKYATSSFAVESQYTPRYDDLFDRRDGRACERIFAEVYKRTKTGQ